MVEEEFELTGAPLNRVEGFIYLGLPIGNSEFVNKYWDCKFRSVEKAFFSIRNIGLHKGIINPICLGFIYKCYCQSIFNYGLEMVFINNKVLKECDTRQGLLIKMALGLSKYTRNRPLLEALNIESITQLYYKHKVLFYSQLKNNLLAYNIFQTLNTYYTNNGTPKTSYINQYIQCEKIIGKKINELKKDTLSTELGAKFGCQNAGLVDSIRFALHNYEGPEGYELLRGLVWVDFYS